MSIADRLKICTACRHGDGLPPCVGPCPCPADGAPIVRHATAGECPRGRFPRTGLAKLAHGAAGLLKATIGADRVTAEVEAERLATCAAGCPEWTGSKCRLCGCYTAMKVKLRAERCPLGKWEAT